MLDRSQNQIRSTNFNVQHECQISSKFITEHSGLLITLWTSFCSALALTLIRHPLPWFEVSDWLSPTRLLPRTLVVCLSSSLAVSSDTDMDERSLASFTAHWTKHREHSVSLRRVLSDCRLGSTAAPQMRHYYVRLRFAAKRTSLHKELPLSPIYFPSMYCLGSGFSPREDHAGFVIIFFFL
jgi:hypothetical protein